MFKNMKVYLKARRNINHSKDEYLIKHRQDLPGVQSKSRNDLSSSLHVTSLTYLTFEFWLMHLFVGDKPSAD